MRHPNPDRLQMLRKWLKASEGGDFFLRGVEADVYYSNANLDIPAEKTVDLVAMIPGPAVARASLVNEIKRIGLYRSISSGIRDRFGFNVEKVMLNPECFRPADIYP